MATTIEELAKVAESHTVKVTSRGVVPVALMTSAVRAILQRLHVGAPPEVQKYLDSILAEKQEV